MITKNYSFINFFFNINTFIFINCYNIKIYNILLIFRFSKFTSSYINVYSFFFDDDFSSINFNKKNFIYNQPLFQNNYITYFNLFFLENSYKFYNLKHLSQIRQNNLLKKYNDFQRFMFYDKYEFIRKLYQVDLAYLSLSEKDIKFSNNENINNYNVNTILDSEIYTYSFFKKLESKNTYFNVFQKKRLFYNLKKNFFKKLYPNRLIFKKVFLKSSKHQHSITKFVEKFKTSKYLNIYKQSQLLLFLVLLSGQFFFFKKDCFFFLKIFGVFLNGQLCTNPYRCLKPGDVIQLTINNNYFFFFKNYREYIFFFLKRYKYKFNKLFLSKKKKYRTKSYYIPNWVNYLAYYYEDVPAFLEIDFTILTIIIIYSPDVLYDTHTIICNNILLYLHRIYNWRRLG